MLYQHGQGFKAIVGKVEFVFAFTDLTSEILREQQLEIALIIYPENFFGLCICF